MVQWNLKGYVLGSILIQADRGEGVKEGISIISGYKEWDGHASRDRRDAQS
jgi:hypothetical protein